ncbi:MAG: hypothetical protein Q4C47_06255, partial [Planctomycetia bacterium]|nr:hypothetical protein [Planctomycetia bacterium]
MSIPASDQNTYHVPGDFSTICEAVRVVEPGSRILVAPGVYTGGFPLSHPLEILRDPRTSDASDEVVIVVQNHIGILLGSDGVLFRGIRFRSTLVASPPERTGNSTEISSFDDEEDHDEDEEDSDDGDGDDSDCDGDCDDGGDGDSEDSE